MCVCLLEHGSVHSGVMEILLVTLSVHDDSLGVRALTSPLHIVHDLPPHIVGEESLLVDILISQEVIKVSLASSIAHCSSIE